MLNVADEPDRTPGGRASTPTASSRSFNVDPNRGHGVRSASSTPRCASSASARRRCSPPGCSRRCRSTTRRCTRSTRSAWSSTSRSSSTPACPGPRVPMACQDVAHIDEVCWFFPELKLVMRHGAEPWTDAGGEAHAQVAEPLLLDLAPSRRSTTPTTSSTTPTPAAPTRSCTPATSRWA